MSRYIDASELISAMYYYEHNEGGLTAYDAQDIINKAPSIDIVRCKECKHKDTYCDYCHKLEMNIKVDDFCSYGERSE